ncbi:hypothetical protein IAT40_002571 [Kwoniella sp. CBS 6097]
MGKRKADGDAGGATSWEAPTEEEFLKLKRYKSFLLPPKNSYAVGQFVWLAHESLKAAPATKRGRQSISTPVKASPQKRPNGVNKSEPGRAADSAVAGAGVGAARVPGTYVRTERDEADDEKWNSRFWLGQIIEIRANGTTYVWVKIRWLCRDLAELKEQNIKTGLPKTHPGGREVFMLGPQFDALQPVGVVEGAANVIAFDERDPLQAPMDPHAIFYRSEGRVPTEAEANELKLKRPIQESAKKLRASAVLPAGHLFPFREPTCYCGEGYRPISRPPAPMAMCTNHGCYKWFHLGCLDWGKDHRTEPTPGLLQQIQTSGGDLVKLLSPEYDYDDVSPLPLPAGVKAVDLVSEVVNPENGPATVPKELTSKELAAAKYTPKLPLVIYRAAQSPVIRGSEETGIVGNARRVLRARQIVQRNQEIHAGGTIDGLVAEMAKQWLTIWLGEAGQEDIDAIRRSNGELVETKSKVEEGVKKEIRDGLVLGQDENENGQDCVSDDPNPPRATIWLCPSCKHPI